MSIFLNKRVKVVYWDGDKEKALHGTVVEETDDETTLRFYDGRLTRIKRSKITRTTEEKNGP